MMSQRDDLERMRTILWAAMVKADAAVIAQIAGRLQAVIKELAALAGGHEETLDDVLAQRRKAREAGTHPSGGPRSSGSKRTS